MRVTRLIISAIAATAAVLAALPTTAGAIGPEPVTITLTGPAGLGICPRASYVVINPGVAASPTFLVVPPGPVGCPPGIDLTINADATGTAAGEAVAQPLTASSCQAGTELITNQITALGQTPETGISSTPAAAENSACPSGDAALSQLQDTIAQLPRALEGEGIYYYFAHSHAGHVLVVAGAAGISGFAGTYDTATGTPLGEFTLRSPSSPPALFALQRSSTAGISTVVCDLCLEGH